jgi:hypothetical protein
MVLSEIHDEIALDIDFSSTAPSSDTTEYARRTKYINRWERFIRQAKGGKWKFLEKSTTLTTTPSQDYVNLPATYTRGSSLVDPAGYITINNILYKLVESDEKDIRNSTDYICWIRGSDAEGYKLYIQPTPSSAQSFTLRYYTSQMATDTLGTTEKEVLVLSTDITKIPNPYIIVYGVESDLLFSIGSQTALATQRYNEAQQLLEEMIARDEEGETNQDTSILDVRNLEGYSPFGGAYND